MAGGPHAAVVMCLHCTGRATRVCEGSETDWYVCDECERKFGIDWSKGAPDAPRWPPDPEELEQARRLLALMGKTLPRSD